MEKITESKEKNKILKTERIQDGVNRIVFAAGKRVEAYQKEEQALYNQIVNDVVHIFDGDKLTSAASGNVNIDLRDIALEVGKILGGSGGGKPKMTQCGGPKKDSIEEALEKAKQLTKKKLEKK